MTDTVICVENLGKRYRIGLAEKRPDNLRQAAGRLVKSPFHYLSTRLREPEPEEIIWALRDVSFEVKQGEVVGIIGRNGAGKSTLLKILTHITDPTEGRAVIRGRVGSLLEIGTGFHQELTGRENIYLNGAILGMKKAEIDRQFDEIVDFSGVEQFIDTPVKRYSSGMNVRLGFAVAAHLEPEILLVDEVLAVGDVSFQKKCLGKMGEVAREGRTVLFVSHNMNAINALCSDALLLENGHVVTRGGKEAVVQKYLEMTSRSTDRSLGTRKDRNGSGRLRFVEYFLEDGHGQEVPVFRSGQDACLAVRYISNGVEELKNVSVAFALNDYLGNQFTDLASRISDQDWPSLPPSGIIRCHIPRLPLMPGTYTFNVYATVNGMIADAVAQAGEFEVAVGDFYSTGRVLDRGQGVVLFDHHWTAEAEATV